MQGCRAIWKVMMHLTEKDYDNNVSRKGNKKGKMLYFK